MIEVPTLEDTKINSVLPPYNLDFQFIYDLNTFYSYLNIMYIPINKEEKPKRGLFRISGHFLETKYVSQHTDTTSTDQYIVACPMINTPS